jgi:hypothetical protein
MTTLEKVQVLVGKWRGEGVGVYPTINSFEYGEEVEFMQLPNKPILTYVHKTWNKETKAPMHHEQGYLRALGNTDHVEFCLSQPTGIAEVEEGVVVVQEKNNSSTTIINLDLKSIIRTSTARHPFAVEISRTLTVTTSETGTSLAISVDMGTENTPKQRHLTAKLLKVQ